MKEQVKQEKNILADATHFDYKGWYFSCYKHRHRIQRSILIIKNKQAKQDKYLNKLTKNLVIVVSSFWTRY